MPRQSSTLNKLVFPLGETFEIEPQLGKIVTAETKPQKPISQEEIDLWKSEGYDKGTIVALASASPREKLYPYNWGVIIYVKEAAYCRDYRKDGTQGYLYVRWFSDYKSGSSSYDYSAEELDIVTTVDLGQLAAKFNALDPIYGNLTPYESIYE